MNPRALAAAELERRRRATDTAAELAADQRRAQAAEPIDQDTGRRYVAICRRALDSHNAGRWAHPDGARPTQT